MEQKTNNNTLETIVNAVVTKVRKMFASNSEYKDLVEKDPNIDVEYRNGKLLLDRISFDGWDSLIVTKNGIVFSPYRGNDKTLMKFKSFEEFASSDL